MNPDVNKIIKDFHSLSAEIALIRAKINAISEIRRQNKIRRKPDVLSKLGPTPSYVIFPIVTRKKGKFVLKYVFTEEAVFKTLPATLGASFPGITDFIVIHPSQASLSNLAILQEKKGYKNMDPSLWEKSLLAQRSRLYNARGLFNKPLTCSF